MTPEWRKPPPNGCVTVEEHECEFLRIAELLEKQIATLLVPSKDGTVAAMVVSRAKELSLAAIKARKCAADLALAREQAEHVDWLDSRRKEMTALRSGQRRAPLRAVIGGKDPNDAA